MCASLMQCLTLHVGCVVRNREEEATAQRSNLEKVGEKLQKAGLDETLQKCEEIFAKLHASIPQVTDDRCAACSHCVSVRVCVCGRRGEFYCCPLYTAITFTVIIYTAITFTVLISSVHSFVSLLALLFSTAVTIWSCSRVQYHHRHNI